MAKSVQRISGPTAAFAIGGFTAAADGDWLVVINTTSQTMTLKNESAGSTAANRILTGTGADFVVTGSVVILIYDVTTARWRMLGGGSGSLAIVTAVDEALTPVPDGVNAVFYHANVPVGGSEITDGPVARNEGIHYDRVDDEVTFREGWIPRAGRTLRGSYEYVS